MPTLDDNPKILVVDDDPSIRNLISRFLNHKNYRVETAANGQSARKLFREFYPDLVILDIHLPDASGLNLCKEIKEISPNGEILVMMLTCMDDPRQIVESLTNIGADYYETKPFDIHILAAHVEALLRLKFSRPSVSHSGEKITFKNGRIQLGDHILIDSDQCKVTLKEELITLTSLEFDLLYFFATHPNQVWTRSELIAKVWNEDFAGYERKVDVHIGQLRKKIDDPEGALIKTIRGKGYICETSGVSE